jgi:mRNA-degrading endonuclease RelE of RelBE toxin-antitoxin system
MIVLKTKNYRKRIDILSKKDKTLLSRQEKLIIENMYHPKLHTKKLNGFGDEKVFAFRITRSYRGVFALRGDTIFLFTMGHRKEIYQKI